MLSLVIQRTASSHCVETTTTNVPLPNDELKGRIIGKEGRNIKAIEKTPRAAAVQQKLVDRLAEVAKQTEDLSAKLAAKNADLAEARANLTEALRELRIDERAPSEAPKP